MRLLILLIGLAVPAWAELTPAQKAALKPYPKHVFAPAVVPPGFRLAQVKVDKEKHYHLIYESKGGPTLTVSGDPEIPEMEDNTRATLPPGSQRYEARHKKWGEVVFTHHPAGSGKPERTQGWLRVADDGEIEVLATGAVPPADFRKVLESLELSRR